jgi:hypothetical protein
MILNPPNYLPPKTVG